MLTAAAMWIGLALIVWLFSSGQARKSVTATTSSRFALVVHWLCCGLALIFVALAFTPGVVSSKPLDDFQWLVVIGSSVAAILVYLLGRAILFIFAEPHRAMQPNPKIEHTAPKQTPRAAVPRVSGGMDELREYVASLEQRIESLEETVALSYGREAAPWGTAKH
jgi:hypothetical protein